MNYTYVQPGKVFRNIYFVGVAEASTHIINTGAGLILIDPGYDDSFDAVVENIKSLGFSTDEIKIILLSHGHYDHAGSAKRMRELTGAKIYLGKDDLKMVDGTEDTALSPDPNYIKKNGFTPDVLLNDGDTVSLGNTEILCLSTPGHTDGTMSFFFNVKDGIKTFRAGMHGGVGTNTLTTEFLRASGLPLSAREKYLGGLAHVRNQHVDVFLGNHTWNNDTLGKLEKVRSGNTDAFVCPDEWVEFIDGLSANMNQIIKRQQENDAKVQKIIDGKVVAIVRGIDKENIIPTVQALYNGGIRAVEFTFDASLKIPDSAVKEYIRMTSEQFGDKMCIGAGTVLNSNQVAAVKEAGGSFIISPDTNAAVIKRTKELGLLSFPGAFTPSEAVLAYNAGADMVKIFPISSLGPAYIKNIAAPLSQIKFMAVGGVNASNAADFIAAGASCVGVGSCVVNKSIINSKDFAKIEALAHDLITNVNS